MTAIALSILAAAVVLLAVVLAFGGLAARLDDMAEDYDV